jgi:hypothetical protein
MGTPSFPPDCDSQYANCENVLVRSKYGALVESTSGSRKVRGISNQVTTAGTPDRKHTCLMVASYLALFDIIVYPLVTVTCAIDCVPTLHNIT